MNGCETTTALAQVRCRDAEESPAAGFRMVKTAGVGTVPGQYENLSPFEVDLMDTDPKIDPASHAAATATAEPRFSLLVLCTECGQGSEAPLPLDRASLERFLAQVGWHAAVLTPPGQGPEVPILLSALCASCAPNVFPPEVMKVAEERRRQVIQQERGSR